VRRADKPYHLHVLIALKSGSLNLLETLGPVQACNGIAFCISYLDVHESVHRDTIMEVTNKMQLYWLIYYF